MRYHITRSDLSEHFYQCFRKRIKYNLLILIKNMVPCCQEENGRSSLRVRITRKDLSCFKRRWPWFKVDCNWWSKYGFWDDHFIESGQSHANRENCSFWGPFTFVLKDRKLSFQLRQQPAFFVVQFEIWPSTSGWF